MLMVHIIYRQIVLKHVVVLAASVDLVKMTLIACRPNSAISTV